MLLAFLAILEPCFRGDFMSDQKVYIDANVKISDLLRFMIPISILLTFKITHTIGDYEYEQDGLSFSNCRDAR